MKIYEFALILDFISLNQEDSSTLWQKELNKVDVKLLERTFKSTTMSSGWIYIVYKA